MPSTLVVNPRLFVDLQIELLRRWLPLAPQGVKLAHLNAVLDVGCGLHQWGKDVFRAMMEQAGRDLIEGVRIDGIEHDEVVVTQANSGIRAGRGNVQVFLADMYDLPEILHQSYDLVHARFLSPYVPPSNWPTVLDQLVQAARPGGWVVWIEPELPAPMPAVPAWDQWLSWSEQAVQRLGGSPTISQQMEDVFRCAGTWEHIESNVTTIRLGFSSRVQGRIGDEQMRKLHRQLSALHPLLLAAKVASVQQLDETLSQVLEAFAWRQLQSTWTWHTVYGRKKSL